MDDKQDPVRRALATEVVDSLNQRTDHSSTILMSYDAALTSASLTSAQNTFTAPVDSSFALATIPSDGVSADWNNFVGTDSYYVPDVAPVIDHCDQGHKFAKLSDHPTKDGKPRCPHCMAIGLDKLSEEKND